MWGKWVWQGCGREEHRGCPYREGAVGRWWCGFLLDTVGSPRMAGLRVDFGLFLEPLGFIKVLEWVSGAGEAQRGDLSSPHGAVSSLFQGLASLLCHSWVELEGCVLVDCLLPASCSWWGMLDTRLLFS